MTRVLLVTDNERVQKVFEDLEKAGVLQLRAVANLMQSEEEISAFCPEFTFVQSRISGLSGGIVLRHLRKLLPAEGETVLLAVDDEDAARGRAQGGRVLDLSENREDLAADISAVLEGAPDPVTKKAAGTGRRRAAKKAGAPGLPPQAGELPGQSPAAQEEPCGEPAPVSPLPPQELTPLAEPPAATVERSEVAPESPERREHHPALIENQEEAAPAPEAQAGSSGAASFAEMMRRAAENQAAASQGAAEDSIEIGKRPEPSEAAAEPPGKIPEPPGRVAEPPVEVRMADDAEVAASVAPPAGGAIWHRGKRRPLWTFPLILIVILVPLLYLLMPQKKTPPRHNSAAPLAAAPPAGAPARVTAAADRPAPAPAPPHARAVTAGTKPFPAKPSAPLPAAKAPVRPAQPTPAPRPAPGPGRHGLSELPPFLRGVTLDAAYAKGHPGWQRYLGARAEYKLFREGGVYRAIQVIALTGQTIPDDIFRKVLQEFGGIDSYQIRSTEKKQHFLVDHGTGKGDVGVTVYRRINDHRVKGLVLYYMQ
jgi:CheY-like chemotaxis protein